MEGGTDDEVLEVNRLRGQRVDEGRCRLCEEVGERVQEDEEDPLGADVEQANGLAQLAALEFVEVLLGVDRAACGGRFCCRY